MRVPRFGPKIHIIFPISRDPPEGGTNVAVVGVGVGGIDDFQFLGIPPKGELPLLRCPIPPA